MKKFFNKVLAALFGILSAVSFAFMTLLALEVNQIPDITQETHSMYAGLALASVFLSFFFFCLSFNFWHKNNAVR